MEELGSMGTTDKTKRLVNILSEMLLIMACYYLSGVIRVYLPWGRAYAFRDTLAYGYLAVLYTAVFVLIHDLSGGYKSLKFGGFRREILRIAVGELLGCLVMTSVIYIFRLEQFSRLLLILFLLCSAAALLVKRIVVSHFYMKYSQTKGSFNVLLVGAGPATARLRQALAEADVILSKGSGNLESLAGCGLNVYYIFMCKCRRVSKILGCPNMSGQFLRERALPPLEPLVGSLD